MPRRGLISPERRRIFRFWLPLRVVRGHPRLFAGIAVSFLAGILLPDFISPGDKTFDRLERGNLALFHCLWDHDRPGDSAIDPAAGQG